MKNIARLCLIILLLVGSLSTVGLADGGGPTPLCNPITNPNCPPPGGLAGH